MFSRATITLGIGPHSSFVMMLMSSFWCCQFVCSRHGAYANGSCVDAVYYGVLYMLLDSPVHYANALFEHLINLTRQKGM